MRQQIYENGAQLNSEDKDGWTGFHSACGHGQHEIVSLLLKEADGKGIDINAVTKDGENGLDIARRKDHTKIVAILSEADIRKIFMFLVDKLPKDSTETTEETLGKL